MKIFCIGRNYADHAKEMNSPVPEKPMIFMKPSTALLANNNAFYYPEFSSNIHYEVEVILKVGKNGRHIDQKFANSYYDMIGLGIDFTARDVQAVCKEKGHPWEIAKSFDFSAVISREFIPKDQLNLDDLNFRLEKNGEIVQQSSTKHLIFKFDKLISYISTMFTLKMGDMIYTGTPAGVGPVQIGDVLKGYIEDQLMFECEIK